MCESCLSEGGRKSSLEGCAKGRAWLPHSCRREDKRILLGVDKRKGGEGRLRRGEGGRCILLMGTRGGMYKRGECPRVLQQNYLQYGGIHSLKGDGTSCLSHVNGKGVHSLG